MTGPGPLLFLAAFVINGSATQRSRSKEERNGMDKKHKVWRVITLTHQIVDLSPFGDQIRSVILSRQAINLSRLQFSPATKWPSDQQRTSSITREALSKIKFYTQVASRRNIKSAKRREVTVKDLIPDWKILPTNPWRRWIIESPFEAALH